MKGLHRLTRTIPPAHGFEHERDGPATRDPQRTARAEERESYRVRFHLQSLSKIAATQGVKPIAGGCVVFPLSPLMRGSPAGVLTQGTIPCKFFTLSHPRVQGRGAGKWPGICVTPETHCDLGKLRITTSKRKSSKSRHRVETWSLNVGA